LKTVTEKPSHMAFHEMNVTKAADWKATMDAAVEKFGKVDILVNNAGTSYINKPTLTVTEDEFERVFAVNVKGVYLGCNAFMPQAIARNEGGVVINIASTGATRPRPGLVWYNASKGAIWNVCHSQ
jgi:NAD(P)-dependent dehydrogenase (short-subunit alcohol dehydrogenase family)